MKLKKSQLKEAIKSIARDCLNERHESGQRAKIEQIVEFVVRKAPATKRNAQKLAEVAGQLFKKQFGVVAKPNLLMEAAYKVVAPKMATDAKEDKARRIQHEPKVNETQTLPPNKGQYKTVTPHAYTTTDQNKALTIQSDPEVNEYSDSDDEAHYKKVNTGEYIGGHVPGSDGKNKFVSQNQIDSWRRNKQDARLQPKPKSGMDEMGLTSELDSTKTECEPCVEPCGGEGQYDEREEIKLIKVMKLAAEKLEAMHQGMPGDEEPVELPSDAEFAAAEEDPSNESPFEEPEVSVDVEEPETSEEEPSDEPSDDEPPFKKKEKKEEDPTEFTKKLAKENHKVQKRSYRTSNDTPSDPKNLRDPNVPGT